MEYRVISGILSQYRKTFSFKLKLEIPAHQPRSTTEKLACKEVWAPKSACPVYVSIRPMDTVMQPIRRVVHDLLPVFIQS